MGFRSLRVLNEDRVKGGAGFPPHRHRDMEILTYVLSGGLAHEDSTGGGSVIRPGEVQRMSAGSGVVHSEFNASSGEPVHFLQVWIVPATRGIAPGYEQMAFPAAGPVRLIASPDGVAGSLRIHQDVRVHAGTLVPGERVEHALADGRGAWLHVAQGAVTLNGRALAAGDGAAIEAELALSIVGVETAEILLFDLA